MKHLIAFLFLSLAIFAQEPKRVVILGDSLTAGYGIDPDEAYPALLQQKVEAAKLPFTIINAGLSGDTTAGGVRRVDWVLRQPTEVLVIELGGNDGLRGIPISETRTNLQAIIDRAKKKHPHIKIVMAGMKMPANMGDYAVEFEKTFPELARKNNATLIPFLLDKVGGIPELNLPDRIHPTSEGHKIVAETAWKTLASVLTERASPKTSPAKGENTKS
jgi:acyl-CoA thioesterase I